MPFLEMKGISKRFGSVLANDRISFDVDRGEVHSLLGENGAGKSTLMNILFGLYTPDGGEIRLNGSPVRISSPHVAIEHNIGMIHQHFMLIPRLAVAENIILGLPSSRPPFLFIKQAREGVDRIARRYGISIDPKALVSHMPVGLQQRVEILKALYRKTDLLILDEPTAVLTPHEVEALFKVIQRLTTDGLAIIFISHKLNEVMAVSDRITVLKRGCVVGTFKRSDTDPHQLANLMVGKEMTLSLEKTPIARGEKILGIKNLWAWGEESANPALRDISLDVHEGEIVGIAGVDGNGQNELSEVIAGLRQASDGRIGIKGLDVTHCSPWKRIEMGLAYIPADRQKVGLIMDLSIAENLVLKRFRVSPFSRKGFFLHWKALRENAERIIHLFNIKASDGEVPVSSLSGGNQQKVILARELTGNPEILLAMQPTRGLDVGSARYVHDCILRHRERGGATLFVSTELDEILEISDRIAVMYEGKIMGVLPGGKGADVGKISLMMAGVQEEKT
jgi:ABC-type uncharacterized transport system ATPase subunit